MNPSRRIYVGFPAVISAALLAIAPLLGDIQWKSLGPGGGGNMRSSTISPTDANIVLMGSDVGGIYRTADGGQTWQLVNSALVDPTRAAGYGVYGDFAFDPTDSNIVYHGPVKSFDAGATWQVYIDDSRIMNGRGTVIDPNDTDMVYTFGQGNVYRSSDGWMSTSCLGDPSAPGNPNTVCGIPAVSCQPDSRCYQRSCLPASGDGPSETGCQNNSFQINDLVINAADHTHLLACAREGLFESKDDQATPSVNEGSGSTWMKLHPTMINPNDPYPLDPNGFSCERLYQSSSTLFMVLRTNPFMEGTNNPFTWKDIDSWRGGAYRSFDFGQTWESIMGRDGDEILPDPGFEDTPLTAWSLDAQVQQVSDPLKARPGTTGTMMLKIEGVQGPQTQGARTNVAITGGELHRLSAWYRVDGADSTMNTIYPASSKVFYYTDTGCTVLATWPGLSFNSVEAWNNTVKMGDPAPFDGEWRHFETILRPPLAAICAKVVFRASTGGGTTWVDDVSLREMHSLPRINGRGDASRFASYSDIVVDSEDTNTIYVGTYGSTVGDLPFFTSLTGVWKSGLDPNGHLVWSHVTRRWRLDNVDDGAHRPPFCGDLVCGGKWEDPNTCADDCSGTCGNGSCDGSENQATCPADCVFEPDPNCPGTTCIDADHQYNGGVLARSPHYYHSFAPWSLAIGNGPSGHLTLYAGHGHLKTTNGGVRWKETQSVFFPAVDLENKGTRQAAGESNDIYAHAIYADPNRGWLLYGDADSELRISYNGGVSFGWEGWQWEDLGIKGDAATSIIPGESPNELYVGVSSAAGSWQPGGGKGGVTKGVYTTPESGDPNGRWSWTPVPSNQAVFQKGGGIDLIRLDGNNLLAAQYGQGLYKIDLLGNTASQVTAFDPPPARNKLYRLFKDESTGRLYVAVGDPKQPKNNTPPSDETGVWASSDGNTWKRISDHSDPNDPNDLSMDQEPVVDIGVIDGNTILAATWGVKNDPGSGGGWNGRGGLYRGVRDPNGVWTWTWVLHQPKVTGLAVSPDDNSVVYALAAQPCCSEDWPGLQAGVYKSIDGGLNWTFLANNGLGNLRHARLYIPPGQQKKIYAATIGSGLFEGTITCGTVSEGFLDTDMDGDPDCSDDDDDGDGDPDVTDCAPLDPLISHSASEVCSGGVDEDCDGDVDCADSDCASECCGNGVCELYETCASCAADCITITGGTCGNGLCEAGNGEDCLTCPDDCNGKTKGGNPFCCGAVGEGCYPSGDPGDNRCFQGPYDCTEIPETNCCGDATCDPTESLGQCPADCCLQGGETCTSDEQCCSRSCTGDLQNPGTCLF